MTQGKEENKIEIFDKHQNNRAVNRLTPFESGNKDTQDRNCFEKTGNTTKNISRSQENFNPDYALLNCRYRTEKYISIQTYRLFTSHKPTA